MYTISRGGAVVIPSLPLATSQDTRNATMGTNEAHPSCAAYPGQTVWYRYTPSAAGVATVKVSDSDFEAYVGMFTGSPSIGFSEQACTHSTISFSVIGGTTYWFQFGGASGGSGSLAIDLHVRTAARPGAPDRPA